MSSDEMLTPTEVAECFKVPLKTVWRWFRNGTLPAVKVGRYWRIRRDTLSAFIEAKENAAHETAGKGQLLESQPGSSR
jgi:excisionase family DNA binding protein